jgi:hypothetical protein
MGMQARSTNVKGFVHFGGDVVAGVEDGIAVQLRSASTGASAIIEPLSDSDTAALTVRAKGAATLTLGNSSNAVALTGSGITVGAGMPVVGIYSTTFAYVYAALTSGQTAEITIASTTADIQAGDLFTVQLGVTSTDVGLGILNIRQDTANASRVTVVVGNIGSTAFGSTGSGTARITWIDLT